jgi:hypothetical protein
VVAGIGYRFAPKASVEADVLRVHHERVIAGGPLTGNATGVFGDLVYLFGEGQTQVFAMGSAGVLNSRTTHTFPSGGGVRVLNVDETDFAWGGGAGVKLFVSRRFSVRPQFRIVVSERTGVLGLASASVSAAYHW